VLVVVLAATATIVDKRESLRWLWVALIVAGVLVGAPAAFLASPWWQQRQADSRAKAEAAIGRARERTRDLRDHFDPRGRGVLPFAGRRGWYFTGRAHALEELAGWLAGPPGGRPAMRVVTGAPGSGKSAVLGRLVLLADPAHRTAALMEGSDLDPTMLPPERSIDLSFHARGRTAQQLVEAAAAKLGVEATSVEDLLAALQERPEPATVVVDGVDEASGVQELADVLARLAQTGGIRLLVGVRRQLVDRLVAPEQAIDLDHPAYLVADDVVEYVRRCLVLDGDPDAPTPYRGRPDLAGVVARAVAAQAGGSFLVAQLVSLELVRTDQVVDVTEPGWQERFPREVGQAMRAYLDGFGPDRTRVRDLLAPLAFAEGDGLADEAVWAALASELGTATYQSQDVRWLLYDTSAPNLLQPTNLHDGTVAWRLFHQALGEYLRDRDLPIAASEVQRRITQALCRRVPRQNGRPDWLAADVYTRCHLPAHAAGGGRLDELVVDPGVLLVAEPTRLLPLLSAVTSPSAQAAAHAYQQAVHQLGGDRPLGQQASCLLRAARYCGADDLAARISQLQIALPWTTRWAHWQTTGISRRLTGPTWSVMAVAFGEVDGQPVIISGNHDQTVRMWDARTGQARGEPLTGHTDSVHSVAVGVVDGRPVIVSSDANRIVRVWDARTGQRRDVLLTGHTYSIHAAAFGEVDGQPVVVTADDWLVRLWDARTGQPRTKPRPGHTGQVNAVAFGEVDGQPVIISGGHDQTVRLWDARTGQPRGDPLTGHAGAVMAVAFGEVDGQPVVISGGEDHTVRVWDARTGQPRGEQRAAHASQVNAVAFGVVDGQPVVISGGEDQTVRVWDARTGQAPGERPVGHTGPVMAVAFGEVDGQPVVISGGKDHTVRLWDARTGQPRGDPIIGHNLPVLTVAFGVVDDQPVIVSGGREQTVRVWDARTGQLRLELLTDHIWVDPVAVAVGEVDGQPVVVTAGRQAVQVWDTRTGQLRRELRGDPMGRVYAVAFGDVDGLPVIIGASDEQTMWVWDARTGQPRGVPGASSSFDRSSAVLGKIGDRTVIASAGYSRTVWVGDARTGLRYGERLSGHTDRINVVAVGDIDGQPVIISGSDDQTVRVWDPHTGQCCCIEAEAAVYGVCTFEDLVVATTALGLAAFQVPTAADEAYPSKNLCE
jgi:WD40 repeat protein